MDKLLKAMKDMGDAPVEPDARLLIISEADRKQFAAHGLDIDELAKSQGYNLVEAAKVTH